MEPIIEQSLISERAPESLPALPRGSAPFRPFLIAAGALILAFGKVFFDLISYAARTDLHSHILLVPFISAYLVYQNWRDLPQPAPGRSPLAVALWILGVVTLGGFVAFRGTGSTFSFNDSLSITVLAFCFLFLGIAVRFLGTGFTRAITFPLCFLFFLVPLPDALTHALETLSKHASAETYAWMMDLSQATYYRTGLVFALPNLTIEVAQECSGIRSSLVLFITSLIAAYMFLRSPGKRALLAFAVFPLGIARNAFRIYTLSMLSVHWDPGVIHSPLHHSGGPVFFALSLIPFFGFLYYLRRTERKNRPTTNAYE